MKAQNQNHCRAAVFNRSYLLHIHLCLTITKPGNRLELLAYVKAHNDREDPLSNF